MKKQLLFAFALSGILASESLTMDFRSQPTPQHPPSSSGQSSTCITFVEIYTQISSIVYTLCHPSGWGYEPEWHHYTGTQLSDALAQLITDESLSTANNIQTIIAVLKTIPLPALKQYSDWGSIHSTVIEGMIMLLEGLCEYKQVGYEMCAQYGADGETLNARLNRWLILLDEMERHKDPELIAILKGASAFALQLRLQEEYEFTCNPSKHTDKVRSWAAGLMTILGSINRLPRYHAQTPLHIMAIAQTAMMQQPQPNGILVNGDTADTALSIRLGALSFGASAAYSS